MKAAVINLMFTHEPFREYESCFNVHAGHLSSKESGVDREPGSVEVDSALDGKVEWERVLLDDWEAIAPHDRTHHSNISIVRELMHAIEEDRDVAEASSGRNALAALEMIMAVH